MMLSDSDNDGMDFDADDGTFGLINKVDKKNRFSELCSQKTPLSNAVNASNLPHINLFTEHMAFNPLRSHLDQQLNSYLSNYKKHGSPKIDELESLLTDPLHPYKERQAVQDSWSKKPLFGLDFLDGDQKNLQKKGASGGQKKLITD